MKMRVAQKTDVGRVREDNQDDLGWVSLPGAEVFVVADGIGGEAGGRTAASMTVSAVQEVFERSSKPSPDLLKTAAEEANRRVYELGSSGDPKFHRMGTTVVILLIMGKRAYWAHAGDSRLYLWRDDALQRLTKDHTQVQFMVDHGVITPEEAQGHPDSNIVTRSVGSGSTIVPSIKLEPMEIFPGDRFLMCTDGLCGLVSDPELEVILAENEEPGRTCYRLVSMALDKGGYDNITVQLISFDSEEDFERSDRSASFPALDITDEKPTLKQSRLLWIIVILILLVLGFSLWSLLDHEPEPGPAQETEKPADGTAAPLRDHWNRPASQPETPENTPETRQETTGPAD